MGKHAFVPYWVRWERTFFSYMAERAIPRNNWHTPPPPPPRRFFIFFQLLLNTSFHRITLGQSDLAPTDAPSIHWMPELVVDELEPLPCLARPCWPISCQLGIALSHIDKLTDKLVELILVVPLAFGHPWLRHSSHPEHAVVPTDVMRVSEPAVCTLRLSVRVFTPLFDVKKPKTPVLTFWTLVPESFGNFRKRAPLYKRRFFR
jgi:hypothetical protein